MFPLGTTENQMEWNGKKWKEMEKMERIERMETQASNIINNAKISTENCSFSFNYNYMFNVSVMFC